MKTKKITYTKSALTNVLLTTLLFFAACSGMQEKKSDEKEASSILVEEVEAPNMDLHSAAFLGDLEAIEQHIQAGTDLNEKEPSMGSTALITAAVFGKTEVARALIKGGADVNLKNNEGSTALHTAAFLCRLEIVELLLSNGADKELQNNYGATALQSISAPFSEVKFIYDQFSKDLGPLGLKLDYAYVEATRPVIADMIYNWSL